MEYTFHFDRETNEYIGKEELEYSPLDCFPLVPLFSTLLEPLESKDGFVVKFIKDSWVYEEIVIETIEPMEEVAVVELTKEEKLEQLQIKLLELQSELATLRGE